MVNYILKINIQLFPVDLSNPFLVLIGGFTLLIKSDNDPHNYNHLLYDYNKSYLFLSIWSFVSQEIQLKLKPHSRFWCITSYNQKAMNLYMLLLQKVLLTRNEIV